MTSLAAAPLLGLVGPARVEAAPIATAGKPPANPRNGLIPPPAEFFGFELGAEGRLAGYAQVEEYLRLITRNSNRFRSESVGTTTMGHEYVVLIASSPRNLARLEQLVEMNQRLGSGDLSEKDARDLAQASVPFYAIEFTIHATEVTGGQMLPNLMYRLATEKSTDIEEMLDNAVVIVIPSQNPDGQYLVVDHFHRTADTSYNRTYPDLYHKYTGHDDNRDFWLFTQIESRFRAQTMQKYRPVAINLIHNKGGGERMFVPPYEDPITADLDANVTRTTGAVGDHMTRELTGQGLSGVTSAGYSILWTPIYLSYLGCAPVLTETASLPDLAYNFADPDGKPLGPQSSTIAYPHPYRSSTWTLRQAITYQEVAALAGLHYVATNGPSLQYNNLHAVARNGRDGGNLDSYAFVIPAAQRDRYATYEVLELLDFTDVEVEQARAPFTADGVTYPADSYVVRLAQPLGRFAHLYLGKVPPTPTGGGTAYKESAGALGMLFGVDLVEIREPFKASLRRVDKATLPSRQVPSVSGSGAYLLRPDSYGAFIVNAILQSRGVPTFRTAKKVTSGGVTYPPGTFVVAGTKEAREALQEGVERTGLPVDAVSSPPRVDGYALKPGTRVGLHRAANNMPGGWIWWMFDHYSIPHQIVSSADFHGALSDRYDTIILPPGLTRRRIVEGLNPANNPEEYAWAYGVGVEGWEKLREFVHAGGTLLAIADAVNDLIELLGLPIVPASTSGVAIPGSMVNHQFDTANPVAWGMPSEWPIWYKNHRVFDVSPNSGSTVVSSYPAQGALILSGDGTGEDALRGKANIVSHGVGQGLVVTYGTEITFRSWPRATLTPLLNAVYHGPSKPVTPDQMATLTSPFANS